MSSFGFHTKRGKEEECQRATKIVWSLEHMTFKNLRELDLFSVK